MALSKIDLDKAGVTGTLPTTNLDTVGVAQGGTGITSGTTDQFLKFTGTTTLASAADNSGLTLISEVATTDVLTVTMDNVFTTDYDNYLLTYTNINFATADDNFGIRLIDTSGTQQTSYFYAYIGYKDGTTGMEGSNGGAIGYAVPFYINSVDLDSASSQGISGFTYIMNPRITGGTYFVSQAGARNGANNAWTMNNTWWASNATYQARGLKFEGMSGTSNFDTYGKFRLYGIAGTG